MKEIQKEFYMAEGALDIYMDKMKGYENINGEKGPYFYLLRESQGDCVTSGGDTLIALKEKEFPIGEQGLIISVKGCIDGILHDPNDPTFNPEDVSNVNVKLEASYSDPNLSDIKRIVEIEIVASAEEINETIPGTPEIKPFPTEKAILSTSLKNVQDKHSNHVGLLTEKFDRILSFYGIDKSILTDNVDNDNVYNLINSSNQFGDFVRYYAKGLSVPKGKTLTIPSGKIVYVDTINLSGGGKPGTTVLKVDGILIVNNLDITGNITYDISGVIMVNNLSKLNGAVDINKNVGVDPGGAGGGYTPPATQIVSGYKLTSNIDKLKLKTER